MIRFNAPQRGRVGKVKELLRTNDPVLISYLTALLAAHDIEVMILDRHTSIIEGSLGILPRRVMVADEDEARARALMKAAEIEADSHD